MYGRYSRQLGEFARLEALKAQEKRRLKEEKARKKELRGYQGTLFTNFFYLCILDLNDLYRQLYDIVNSLLWNFTNLPSSIAILPY